MAQRLLKVFQKYLIRFKHYRIIAFIEDYKIIKKILDYLGIYEFRRDRPPPKRFAVADLFDDYTRCNIQFKHQ